MSWIQTASGRAVDLLAVSAADIDFPMDVAGALARTPRFTGHIGMGPYSVAQHCVIGADAIVSDSNNRELAAAFLLHDAHEAYIGDWSRPLQLAFADLVSVKATELGGPLAGPIAKTAFRDALRAMKLQLDEAIHAAAGVRFPLPMEISRAVKDWDERMLQTERKLFLGPCPREWHWDANPPPIVRWPEKRRVWPWPMAADRYLDALRRYCPSSLQRAA